MGDLSVKPRSKAVNTLRMVRSLDNFLFRVTRRVSRELPPLPSCLSGTGSSRSESSSSAIENSICYQSISVDMRNILSVSPIRASSHHNRPTNGALFSGNRSPLDVEIYPSPDSLVFCHWILARFSVPPAGAPVFVRRYHIPTPYFLD